MTAKESSVTRCRAIRARILQIARQVPAAHIAPAFSCVEICDAVYFGGMMRRSTQSPTGFHDIFIMSKGHGCLAQYAILEAFGILSDMDIQQYCKPGGKLGAHPDYGTPGISASTGSLGHGLGIAVGQAYAEKLKDSHANVYCLLSDGECQSGAVWEAAMVAANLKLSNLYVFVDNNDYGGLERMSEGHPALYPLADKFRAFGWQADEVDGHDVATILELEAYRGVNEPDVPHALICKTVKGKGVSFMENAPIWHYRSPTDAEYDVAMKELAS